MSRMTLDLRSLLLGWSVLFGVWGAWTYGFGVPEYVVASPGRVGVYLYENAGRVSMMAGFTASQALAGWIFGVVTGGAIGAMAYYFPLGRRLVLPPLLALQTTPIIALAPLISFWLGYGWWAKVAVAAVVSMLPVVLAMHAGLGDAKPTHIHTFELANASRGTIFWQVRVRSAWTSVLASLKVAVVFAVIGSIVSEFMGGNTGLGFLIMKAIYGSKGDILIAAVLCSALIGQLFLVLLERALIRWEDRFGAAVH